MLLEQTSGVSSARSSHQFDEGASRATCFQSSNAHTFPPLSWQTCLMPRNLMSATEIGDEEASQSVGQRVNWLAGWPGGRLVDQGWPASPASEPERVAGLACQRMGLVGEPGGLVGLRACGPGLRVGPGRSASSPASPARAPSPGASSPYSYYITAGFLGEIVAPFPPNDPTIVCCRAARDGRSRTTRRSRRGSGKTTRTTTSAWTRPGLADSITPISRISISTQIVDVRLCNHM